MWSPIWIGSWQMTSFNCILYIYIHMKCWQHSNVIKNIKLREIFSQEQWNSSVVIKQANKEFQSPLLTYDPIRSLFLTLKTNCRIKKMQLNVWVNSWVMKKRMSNILIDFRTYFSMCHHHQTPMEYRAKKSHLAASTDMFLN